MTAVLGDALVRVMPDMGGFARPLIMKSVAYAKVAGSESGTAFQRNMVKSMAGIAIGAAVTAGLYKVGKQWDEVSHTIIKQTGASGKALDGLMGSVKNVAVQTPASLNDVGAAVAGLNQRLGLTGKPLEDVTLNIIRLSRVTGTDLKSNIASMTRMFKDWTVPTNQQALALDKVYVVSQKTGIGVDKLSVLMAKFGSPLRQLGLDFDTTAALLGKFEREGVNMQTVMPGMRMGLKNIIAAQQGAPAAAAAAAAAQGRYNEAVAKYGKNSIEADSAFAAFSAAQAKAQFAAQVSGKSIPKALGEVIKSIQTAKTSAEANGIAFKVFGGRAGPDMAAAIREGRFGVDDLLKAMRNGKGTLDDAAKRTRTVGAAWSQLKNVVLVGLEPLATKVFDAISKGLIAVADGTGAFINGLRNANPWVVALTATMGALLVVTAAHAAVLSVQGAGGLLAYLKATKLVTAATKIWAAVQWALNAAMSANPVALVIIAIVALVAAFVIAYKKSETFRRIVQTAWAKIKEGAAAAWRVIKPILVAIGDFIRTKVGPAFQWLWQNVIQPVFRLWVGYMTHVLFPIIRFLWQHVVQPVFKFIWNYLKVWWGIAHRVFQAFWSFLTHVIFPVIKWLWDHVVRPVFSWIGDKIRTVWNNVIKPVFKALKAGVEWVADAFRNAVHAIGRIWDTLKNLVATPVKWIIDVVWNHGIRNVINAIPGVDDVGKITFGGGGGGKTPGTSPGGHTPGKRGFGPKMGFARGGVMPGPKTTGDVHQFWSPTGGQLALRGREAFMVPEFTELVGGLAGVRALNRRAEQLRRRGIHHFAGGGVYRPVAGGSYGAVHDQQYGAPGIDFLVGTGTPVHAVAPGRVTVSQDLAYSYGHWIKLAHAGFNSIYAHLLRRLVGVGANVRGGQVIGLSDSTGKSTGPHLHFATQGRSPLFFAGASTNYGGPGTPGGLGGGALGAMVPMVLRALNPLRFLHLDEWAGKLRGMGEWGGMFGHMVTSVGPAFLDWAKDKIQSAFGTVTDWGGKFLHYMGTGGAPGAGSFAAKGSPQAFAKAMLQFYGWGQNQWPPLLNLWNRESGWDPTIHYGGGHGYIPGLAYGIPQALPGSKMASAGADWMTNPRTQIKWGLGYIRSTYGSPAAAWAHWLSHNSYDEGGIAQGRGILLKNTLRPERKLSPRQTEAFERLVALLERRGGPGPLVNIERLEARDEAEAARRMRAEALKLVALLGV